MGNQSPRGRVERNNTAVDSRNMGMIVNNDKDEIIVQAFNVPEKTGTEWATSQNQNPHETSQQHGKQKRKAAYHK